MYRVRPSPSREPELELPSDAEFDKVISFLEKAWRRPPEMGREVQKDVERTRCFIQYLVGKCEHRRWYIEAERLGSPEVEHRYVSGRRLHRQVGRLLAWNS